MSMFSKGRRYLRKGTRLPNRFMRYATDNPLVAVGMTLVVGTMAFSLAGGKGTKAAKPARHRAAA